MKKLSAIVGITMLVVAGVIVMQLNEFSLKGELTPPNQIKPPVAKTTCSPVPKSVVLTGRSGPYTPFQLTNFSAVCEREALAALRLKCTSNTVIRNNISCAANCMKGIVTQPTVSSVGYDTTTGRDRYVLATGNCTVYQMCICTPGDTQCTQQ